MTKRLNILQDDDDLRSEFEYDPDVENTKKRRHDLADGTSLRQQAQRTHLPSKEIVIEEYNKEASIIDRQRFICLDAYSRHKKMVNDYRLYYNGRTHCFKRDTSKDKRDIDVITENHRFLWDADEDTDEDMTWGQRLAKSYYDKLFKEYCIADLTYYRKNKIALRWRIEKEVVSGKGQFNCGEKHCNFSKDLKSWEVNFAYLEDKIKKNALVKIRLCPDCSYKLNYKHRKKEIKVISKTLKAKPSNKSKLSSKGDNKASTASTSRVIKCDTEKSRERDKSPEEFERRVEEDADDSKDLRQSNNSEEIWKKDAPPTEDVSREDEFQDYFDGMFL